MAMNMKEFLTLYFQQLHFNKMPSAVRDRFNEYVANKNLTGDMKMWRDKLMNPDGSKKDVPAAGEMDYGDWEKLYKVLQSTFIQIQNDEELIKEKKVRDFIDKFADVIDTDNAIEYEADATAQDECDKLARLLENKNNNDARHLVGGILRNRTGGSIKLDDFIKGLNDKKYNTDPEFQGALLDVLYGIVNDKENKALFHGVELDDILDGFVERDVSPYRINNLQSKYTNILDGIYGNKKVLEAFQKYDGGKITGPLATARKTVAYDDKDSKSFIPEKIKDKKNVRQWVAKTAGKIYENQVRPWTDILRGTRMYFSHQSKDIMTALDSVRVKYKDSNGQEKTRRLKPFDGIRGILEHKDEIAGKLANVSKEHFDWFVKHMEKYAKKDNMANAIDGALHNPDQMHKVVIQIIYDAVQSGDIEQAKTAMEILATMKYGFFHSGRVDAMKHTKVSIFGEIDMAKKYEPIGIAARAADFAIKGLLVTAGSIVAAANNQYMRSRLKFRGKVKDSWAFGKDYKELVEKNKKAAMDDAGITPEDINGAYKMLEALAKGDGESGYKIKNEASIEKAKQELEQELDEARAKRQELQEQADQWEQDHILDLDANPYIEQIKEQQDIIDEIQDNQQLLNNDIQNYNNAIEIKNKAKDVNANGRNPYDDLMAHWNLLNSFLKTHRLTMATNWTRTRFLDHEKKNGQTRAEKISDKALVKFYKRHRGIDL